MTKHLHFGNYDLAIVPVFADTVQDPDTVLIFLHEALGSIPQWKGFPQTLCHALGLNGIVYEREGYGQSSPLRRPRTADYLHRYAWEELPPLLHQLLPPEKKVILVGHSDGGSIALLFAAKYPERVRGIISMAAHVIVEDITLKGIEPAVQAFEQGKLSGLQKYHGDKTTALFYAWADTWRLDTFRSWNICAELHPISAPVLAIQGSNDQYGTEKQVALIRDHSGGPVQCALLPGCGHHPHLEKGEDVTAIIQKWYLTL